MTNSTSKSLESWIWDAACSIRGAKDAPKYKDYILPLIFTKRLGLEVVEANIIGKSYEYLIRKFAEGGGQSAGEFYTPGEVGEIMARVMDAEPGMTVYDPCCGSGGLLIKCELAMEAKRRADIPVRQSKGKGGLENPPSFAPLKLFGQEYVPETWAMANMNMIIHDMEGQIEIGDTFKNPKFRAEKSLRRMVQFAEVFPEGPIVATLSRQLGWSHFKELLPLDQPLQRDFYAEMCRVERWSVRTLRDKIDSMLYERTAISRKPEEVAKAELAALRWLAKHEQQPGENPPLGIILCAGKKEEQIELLELDQSGIHVAEYLTALPSRERLQQKLHAAIKISRARLEAKEGGAE